VNRADEDCGTLTDRPLYDQVLVKLDANVFAAVVSGAGGAFSSETGSITADVSAGSLLSTCGISSSSGMSPTCAADSGGGASPSARAVMTPRLARAKKKRRNITKREPRFRVVSRFCLRKCPFKVANFLSSRLKKYAVVDSCCICHSVA